MKVEALVKEIEAAFTDVRWSYGELPPSFTPESASAALDDIFLIMDDAKKYQLPRIMIVAVTQAGPPPQKHLIQRLIEFLNADFEDSEDTDLLLKEARFQTFSNFTQAQSSAIWNWLTFVKVSYELRRSDELASAIRYWGQRVRSG